MQAKVPKKQDWPNSKPGLDCSSNGQANPSSHQCDFHILDLLCGPSVVLRRRRGSCPDLSRNHHMVSQLPDSVAEASKSDQLLIQGHGHLRALRNVLGMCFQLNFHSFLH